MNPTITQSHETLFVDSSLPSEFVSEDGLYFKGSFLEVFMSTDEVRKLLGPNFATVDVDRRIVGHLINERIRPPAFPLGLQFDPVEIYENLDDAMRCNQVLDYPENLNEKVCILLEDGEYDEIWSYVQLDPSIVLRHIPTLTTKDEGTLFHTQHLWTWARAILQEPFNALLFGAPPNDSHSYTAELINEVAAAGRPNWLEAK